jgi:hypothetical protein
MSESDVTAPKPSGDRRVEVGDGQPPFHDRRKAPRPPLAEIRRGGTLNLLPPVVVSGAVRTAEFLLISLARGRSAGAFDVFGWRIKESPGRGAAGAFKMVPVWGGT